MEKSEETMSLSKFQRIIRGSKQFDFCGPVLEVTGYYSGERVKLDLSKVDEEMLEALLPDAEEEPEEDW